MFLRVSFHGDQYTDNWESRGPEREEAEDLGYHPLPTERIPGKVAQETNTLESPLAPNLQEKKKNERHAKITPNSFRRVKRSDKSNKEQSQEQRFPSKITIQKRNMAKEKPGKRNSKTPLVEGPRKRVQIQTVEEEGNILLSR